MNKALIFILAFLLVYSACTEKIEETVEKQPEYPVFTETVDGIKTIKTRIFPVTVKSNINLQRNCPLEGKANPENPS